MNLGGEWRMTRERRKTPRYPAKVADGSVGWWNDESFNTTRAQIENISSGGARLTVELPIPAIDPVWIGLVGDASAQWVQATLVERSDDACPGAWIRVEFIEPCPYEVFATVVCGNRSRAVANRVPVAVGKRRSSAAQSAAASPCRNDDDCRSALAGRHAVRPVATTKDAPASAHDRPQAQVGLHLTSLAGLKQSHRDATGRMTLLTNIVSYAIMSVLIGGLGYLVTQKVGQTRLIEILVASVIDK